MQAASHRKFNAVIALDLLAAFYQKFLWESIVVSVATVLFSSFPDRIEQFGLKHRGVSHSIVLYILMGLFLFCYMVPNFPLYWECCFGIGWAISCMCHVVADMFSKTGINIAGKQIKLNLYSTGTRSEFIFLWTFIVCNFTVLYLLWNG